MKDESTTHATVPTQPGWCLCLLVEGGKDDDGKDYPAYLPAEPIVAWEIMRTERPYHPKCQPPRRKRGDARGKIRSRPTE